MDNNFLFLCVLQVTLANESIVLYMCEGKVLMDMLFFFITLKTILQSYSITRMNYRFILFILFITMRKTS